MMSVATWEQRAYYVQIKCMIFFPSSKEYENPLITILIIKSLYVSEIPFSSLFSRLSKPIFKS